MTLSYQELRDISKQELIARHDAEAKNAAGNVNYYLDEIQRRDASETNRKIQRYTWTMTMLTFVITLATLASWAGFSYERVKHLLTETPFCDRPAPKKSTLSLRAPDVFVD